MFTDVFVKHIQEHGVTPYQIAKNTAISQGLMAAYKRGEKIPSAENMLKIAEYLDVSVDYLLGRTDKPEVNR